MLLGLTLLIANLALQYGAARLPSNVTAVVMLSEVLFASVSSVFLGAGTMGLRNLIGGGLILAASLLSVRAFNTQD
jgi:drug/metabolite transporter (DMT)-like permease